MAVRFAVKTGLWSDVTTWDNGALPVAGDVIYPNGFTVTIDQDINVASLNNNASPIVLPNMNIPAMTNNTQPSGIVESSGNAGALYPYLVFDQNSSTSYGSNTNNTCWITYEYPSARLIKRYYLRSIVVGGYGQPASWNFEGWNGSSWDLLEGKTGMGTSTQTGYTSPVLTHTTLYSKYRLNVTVGSSVGFPVSISQLELGESTGTIYGTGSGGLFTVPSTLSGTRNIVQTGAGIISNNSATVITTAHTSGNTVNFNIQSGGYIFNTLNDNASNEIRVCSINGTGAVNFNGDIYGSQNTGNIYNALGGTIYINANATVTINGNVCLAKGQNTIFYYTIHLASGVSNSAVLNINGNVIGSSLYPYSAIYLNSLATINIVGNLTSDISPCIVTSVTNVFTGGGGFINLTGTANLTNNNSQPCILTRNTLITINGAVSNKNNKMAIWGAFIRMTANTTPYWVFQDTTNANITLAYGSATGAYPAESDVRFGVTYAASPTRTGTCRVPLPQYVSQGVLVDATVGTAYLSATDVWNVLTSTLTTAGSVGKLVTDNLNATVSSRATQTSVDTANTNINNLPANVWDKATNTLTTSGSIGERLKNASTVQTTGDQLASYQV